MPLIPETDEFMLIVSALQKQTFRYFETFCSDIRLKQYIQEAFL